VGDGTVRDGNSMTDAILRRFRPDQIREVVLVLVIVAIIIFFSTQIDGYLSGRTFNRITTTFPIVVVMAVGQVLVVLTRNIDLSIGSIAGLVGYTLGSIMGAHADMSPLLIVALGMGLGGVLGAINGLIVAYGRVPAIITTLATLAIYRVILIEMSEARTVTTMGFPEWLLKFPSATLFEIGNLDIRVVFVIALVVVAIGQFVLRYLPYGRRLYAIGSNPDAAKSAGLPAQRDVFWAFVSCGALAGLAGFLFMAKFGNLTVEAGAGLELQVVAAVVVGGVNIFGGSGSMIGAFLGAVLIELLQQSLVRWIGVSDFLREFLLGALILIAVAGDKILVGRAQESWVRVRRQDDAKARAAREAER
jgi:rhamnose transport system permease protein